MNIKINKMKNELKKEVGRRLYQFRKEIGLTQRELVASLDIGNANYSRIERGEVFPGIPMLQTLQNEFNLSSDWLILNQGGMFRGSEEKDQYIRLADYGEDIRDLLYHMAKIPMVKHMVLSYYLKYKIDNISLIEKYLELEEGSGG